MQKIILIISLVFFSLFSFCIDKVSADDSNVNSNQSRDEECNASWNCFDKPNFMVNTDTFSIWWTWLKKDSWKNTINNVLWNVIQKLMIVLWTISFWIITIWWYFMVTSHWDDSLLTKWKNILKWWIISLFVALSSYYIVNMVSYILYK